MEPWGLRGAGEEHEHLSDAVLESVMVFRLAAGAVAEVVVPLGLTKAGFLSGSTGVLGVVVAYVYILFYQKFYCSPLCPQITMTRVARTGRYPVLPAETMFRRHVFMYFRIFSHQF